jgi:hypothetical protein
VFGKKRREDAKVENGKLEKMHKIAMNAWGLGNFQIVK